MGARLSLHGQDSTAACPPAASYDARGGVIVPLRGLVGLWSPPRLGARGSAGCVRWPMLSRFSSAWWWARPLSARKRTSAW